ncbi:winged helix-turn-helix transcriptional regulator [Streptomyces sp. MBT65]|nr:winged helix-turn-helix transcriptional regulator [Streptomyces sp. MBT65]
MAGGATILALAQMLGVARNTVHARLRRMAADGVLKPVSRRVDPATLGYGLVAFMSLAVSQLAEVIPYRPWALLRRLAKGRA